MFQLPEKSVQESAMQETLQDGAGKITSGCRLSKAGQLGGKMGELDNQGVVTMQELIASSLAQTDALTKLLIEKGIITQEEFMVKLSDERAVYREMLGKMG